MIAYKGFNKDLSCTRGRGTFQYEVGKTYTEQKAECANTGFHCVEEPLEVLTWYNSESSRYCIVEASGDIHEDGHERISCTTIKILKEITKVQLAAMECEWIRKHPKRRYSKNVKKDSGEAQENDIVVVRGKNPKAAGEKGATIFLLKEGKDGTIEEAGAYQIDGDRYKAGVYYDVEGRKARCRKVS